MMINAFISDVAQKTEKQLNCTIALNFAQINSALAWVPWFMAVIEVQGIQGHSRSSLLVSVEIQNGLLLYCITMWTLFPNLTKI